MIKDDIRHPERLGNAEAVVSGISRDRVVGLHSLSKGDVGLVVSTNANETYFSDDVKAVIISAEKAHALGKALIELSGIEEEPVEDKPLHISLEEFRELLEGDQVILRADTQSREVFEFGYSASFHDEIQGKTPVTVTKVDLEDDSIQVVTPNGRYGWFTRKAVKEVVAKAPRHISKEEFDSIEAGDKVVIRKDLAIGKYYGGTYFNLNMYQWAADGVQLKVMPLRSYDGNIKAENLEADDYFNYSREMIQEVIKAPKEHFRVRLSTKIWYAGKGGQITTDKGYAAIMNKPHAENVVKKYGGQLVKVDYSELEEK